MRHESDIFDPSLSLVVVAGAGTGKTYKLVRRYIKLIATKPDKSDEYWATPDQVLAVTFTRAAAAEMRQRIIKELTTARNATNEAKFKENGEVDDVMLEVWKSRPDYNSLIQQIDAAPIDTLHGLCARLLREFPELSGVPVDASPLEPAQEGLALEGFVSSYIDTLMDDQDGEPDANATKTHDNLLKLLKKFPLEKVKQEVGAMVSQSEEIPEDWQNPDVILKLRADFIKRLWNHIANSLIPVVETAMLACEGPFQKSADKIQVKLDELRGFLTLLEAIKSGKYPDGKEFVTIKSLIGKGIAQDNLGKENQSVINAIKEISTVYKQRCCIRGRGIVDAIDLKNDRCDDLTTWVQVGLAARLAYQSFLLQQGKLRFNDLEDRAITLLKSDAAKSFLKNRFKHILVDEFQDTNEKQVSIIKGIVSASGAMNTFYVGDPKQAIYRFRGADVHMFEKTLNEHTDDVVFLNKTRRTSPDLADFFNAFFPQLLDPDNHGLGDDLARVEWKSPIECSRDSDAIKGCPVDLLLRDFESDQQAAGNDPDGDSGETPDDTTSESSESGGDQESEDPVDSPEADRLARYIKALIDKPTLRKVKDPKTGEDILRPLCPADFAILLPKWSVADQFRAALEANNVPAEVAGGRGLFALPEVRDLINLLRFFGDRNDELAAAGVLRGSCFGLSDLGLYVLARWPGVERWTRSSGQFVMSDWQSGGATSGPFKYPRSLRQTALHARIVPETAVNALIDAGVLDAAFKDDVLAQLQKDAKALCMLDANNQPCPESGIVRLATLAKKADLVPASQLLAEAIVDFRLEATWLGSPSGTRAVANAWRFVEQVRQVEGPGMGLADLIGWLNSGTDPTPEGLISGERNAVTITSIHGAKGLEWPVVTVAGIGARTGGRPDASWCSCPVPNLDNSDPLVFPRIKVAVDGFYYVQDPLNEACNRLQVPDEIAETKRLLYVAMTRAMDRVILSGVFKDSNNKRNKSGDLKLSGCATHASYIASLLDLKPDEDTGVYMPRGCWKDPDMLLVITDDKLADPPTPGSIKNNASTCVETIPATPPAVSLDLLDWGTNPLSVQLINPSRAATAKVTSVSFEPFDPVNAPVKVPANVDPRELGKLFHAVMEDWNFSGDWDFDDKSASQRRLTRHAEYFFPGDGNRHIEWLHSCIRLMMDSPLYPELKSAAARGELFHEVDLDALVPPKPGFPGGIRAKGRADLLFKDDNGLWCLLDYKETIDVTTAEKLDRLQKEYGPQLAVYREVLKSWKPGEVGRIGLWLALAGKPWWAGTE